MVGACLSFAFAASHTDGVSEKPPSASLKWRWASGRDGRIIKRSKVELVPVEADSETQRVLERLIEALEKQGITIIRKEKE